MSTATTRDEVTEQWAAVLREMRALLARDPRTKPDLRVWTDDAISLSRRITQSPEVSDKVDEVAWHSLADADIRVKDSEYAELQRTSFEEWLHEEEQRLAEG
ncbi:hypothetical protein MYSTI_02956 [Myxococcus stipitatus DSM 14675]|uniref:Uncharacterized protein n=1 Tax=Myxococcus stipitatus (strain DSM 14675 / JCM 12634 / Mx s8) TaxID=1278073 RepID=L7U9N3_MYXSD|nr:hypothetical protein [Myxococcus stipitatus]AGC44272.1 hypothetical protein MYSTI_02956 [Myxococcus stipitatus DSM 14675]